MTGFDELFLFCFSTGCLCAFVTNQRMSDSISEVNDEVQDAISDLYAFVDDTVKVWLVVSLSECLCK